MSSPTKSGSQPCGWQKMCIRDRSEHREAEWRKLLSDIRQVYHGLLSYNTDKYQEHRVNW